ncbi:unnamed protein product [Cunninghamella blakesleeana]
MNRNHIHLATGLLNDLSVQSGVRSSSQTIFLNIMSTQKMLQEAVDILINGIS